MTLAELIIPLAPVSISVSLDTEIGGLQIDSRSICPGDAFIAIAGTKTDGHNYISQAMNAGAVCVFTQTVLADSVPHVVLRDTQAALAVLAAGFYIHPSRRMCTVGVTGTKGKTTVTQMVRGLMENSRCFRTGLIGTNGNFIGSRELPAERTTPDALHLQGLLAEMLDSGCDSCVMEVSSHALCQGRVDGIYYDVGVFTNLSHDHLDYHGDMENYFEAKKLLFAQCKASVINIDDSYGRRIDNARKLISFGIRSEDVDLRAIDIRLMPDHVVFSAEYKDERVNVEWGAPGEFSVYNALAAIGSCLAIGMKFKDIARLVPGLRPVKGRMERVAYREGVTVLIDYAHSPDSLEKAIIAVSGFVKERIIVVVGCGGDRDIEKRPLMGAIVARLADIAILTTDNPRTEEPMAILRMMEAGITDVKGGYHVICDRTEAIREALRGAKDGDAVLLCGKGHETYQEINGIKHHYDEREIIAQIRREAGG